MKFEKNVGDYEAVVRGVIGAGALAIGISRRNPLWLALSALAFGSAASRICPLNAAFGSKNYTDAANRQPLTAVPTIH